MTKSMPWLVGVWLVLASGTWLADKADGQPVVGEIRMFAGDFAPRGWMLCDGQTLDIAKFEALFSVIGTTYGGDGRTSFHLPDFRGRAPIQQGQGHELSAHHLGQQSGNFKQSIIAHSADYIRAQPYRGSNRGDREPTADGEKMAPLRIAQPFVLGADNSFINTQPPTLAVTFIICVQGIYPPQ